MSRILVVDDDDLVREVVTHQLGAAGHEVVCAEDGEAGLTAALEGEFDLVLLDSMMPKLTGVEVCRRLRDDDRTRRVPIVMLTVKSQEADVQRGFAAGADDFVAKPFSPRELVSRVAAILGADRVDEHASPLPRPATVSFDDLRARVDALGDVDPDAAAAYRDVLLQVEVAANDARDRYEEELEALLTRLDRAWATLKQATDGTA